MRVRPNTGSKFFWMILYESCKIVKSDCLIYVELILTYSYIFLDMKYSIIQFQTNEGTDLTDKSLLSSGSVHKVDPSEV